MAAPLSRFNVLGIGIHPLNLPDATARIIAAASPPHQRRIVCCCDAHSIMQALRNPTHRDHLNQAWLATPDGMPLVHLGHRAGHPHVGRVYGPDLLQSVSRASATPTTQLRHFFYGGSPDVAATLAARLSHDHPHLAICGTYAPPFAPAAELPLGPIIDAQPDFLWVGLSTPKQEAFMARAATTAPFGVALGIGAAFDLLSGRIRQAPPSIRRSGFEWLWRLAHEPRRLTGRYLRTVPAFAFALLAQRLGWHTYPSPSDSDRAP